MRVRLSGLPAELVQLWVCRSGLPCAERAVAAWHWLLCVQEGVSASLDGLRAGDAGERIPREAVSSSSLFTNDLLP
jgi:hypothetical protein